MTRRGMTWAAALALCAAASAKEAVDWVDPFLGSASPGNTTPAATWPMGMVQPGPDSGTAYGSRESGYGGNDVFMGFTQNRLSGTGCCELQDFLIKPFAGEDATAPGRVLPNSETASPGYYAVAFSNLGVRAEMTATPRVACYRFAYATGRARILIDTQAGPFAHWRPERPANRVTESRSDFGADGIFRAENVVSCWVDGRHVSCAIRFDRTPSKVRTLPPNGKPGKRWVFEFDLPDGVRTVHAACAVSSVDAHGACLNLATCENPFDFEARRADARRAWNDLLSRADADGTDDEKMIFYTALYHAYFQPNLFSDADGRSRQEGAEIVRAPEGRRLYTTFSTWDTFRAAHPLYTILTPSVVPDLVAGLVAKVDADGTLPIWQAFGREAYCMPGDHSVAILEEARAKGLFGNADREKAFRGMERSLHRRRGEHYDTLGYYPFDDTSYRLLPAKPYMPVSRQLENVYDDCCAARFAAALGKRDRAAHYRRRADYWKNVYDPDVRMFRGRDGKGAFHPEPFDPFKQGPTAAEKARGRPVFDYTEGSAAHWAWHVLHAPEELIALHGGPAQSAADLDALFRAPETIAGQTLRADCTGQVGQYAHGNEPSHHTAFYYLYAGRPDRTAEIVREIVRRHYGTGQYGLCGNDDCGQMSAWYAFAALGIYPFDPASATYVVGAPQLPRVAVKLENGNVFETVAKGLSDANKYVKSVTWRGKPLDGFVLSHADLMRGGELVFEMTDRPSRPVAEPAWTFDGAPVRLPHTWNAADGADGGSEGPGHNSVSAPSYDRGTHVYATTFPQPREGRRIFLRVPAAGAKATVRVNGRRVGEHVGAFAAFTFELTRFLNRAENAVEIAVDNAYDPHLPPNEGDFTMFGGLYRGAEFIDKPAHCIDPTREIRVDADPSSGHVTVHVPAAGGPDETQTFDFPSPERWSPENPRLYMVRVGVGDDAEEVSFGFRTAEMRADGFYLNGERRVLRGVCRHQDVGARGWAETAADLARDLRLIREMGADAIRTSHYPCSRAFYDMCDRMGLMVWTELPLVDEIPAGDALFAERARTMAREMVAQHRNHPSVVMWGAFNEVYQFRKPDGSAEKVLREVVGLLHELDATRPVVGASNRNLKELGAIPDGLGRNLYPGWYWKDAAKMVEDIDEACAAEGRPAICVSEYGAGAGVRTHGDPLARPGDPCGAWHPEEYQAYFHAATYAGIKGNPKVWGSFVWVMFDAASDSRKEGERHGINDKGLVTRDRRVRKDAYYLYQANWTARPVLHLVGGRMASLTNGTANVLGFSNVGDVTLEVNGRKVATKRPDAVCAVLFRDVPMRVGENRVRLTASDGAEDEAVWTLTLGDENRR